MTGSAPAAELGRRLGVTRARVSQAEQAERAGGVTLRSMQEMAKAMGCRFVYAIVPDQGDIETIILAQAHKKAAALVVRAGTHMAMEQQALPDENNRSEVERIAQDLLRAMPAGFWTDT